MRALFLLFLAFSGHSAIPPQNVWDHEVQSWIVRVQAQTSNVSGAHRIYTTTFVNHLKQWGLRDRVTRVNVYLGTTKDAVKAPLFNGGTPSSTTENFQNFVDGDYTATGLTGNTTTKHILTGINGGFGSLNDAHLAIYNQSASDEASYCMGSIDGTVEVSVLASYSGTSYMRMSTATDWGSVADSQGVGFYVTTRPSSNSIVQYKNGVSINSTNTTSGSSWPSPEVVVHAVNSSGVIAARTSRTLSYYAIGSGISSTQIGPYYKAVQRLQSDAGRPK